MVTVLFTYLYNKIKKYTQNIIIKKMVAITLYTHPQRIIWIHNIKNKNVIRTIMMYMEILNSVLYKTV